MHTRASAFAPYDTLASTLLADIPHIADGSHDIAHLQRVWKNVVTIHGGEGGDLELLAAATLLHDAVHVEKDSPLRSSASRLAADHARRVLGTHAWPDDRIARVAHAIEAHSFSAGITPETLDARILQDADRLDAIGLIGVARCFYTAGRLGSALYDPHDPTAAHRAPDDARFALDHFEAKLLKLASGFRTPTGARLAAARHEKLRAFQLAFLEEISGEES